MGIVLSSLFVLCRFSLPEYAVSPIMRESLVSHVREDSLCHANPYASVLSQSLGAIRSRANNWLATMDEHLLLAAKPEMNKHDHARFAAAFPAMTDCQKSCIGGPCLSDESKIVCGLDRLQKDCVVYSIGGNNQWQFEWHILSQTPCHVHTFDCTGPPSRFTKPVHDRLSFHHVCLGSEYLPYNQDEPCQANDAVCGPVMTLRQIQVMLGHEQIDLLKMDVEGYEWPVFESWPVLSSTISSNKDDVILPMQVLVEIHTRTQMTALSNVRGEDFKLATDIIRLQ